MVLRQEHGTSGVDVDKFERLEQEWQDPVDRAPLEQETLQMWKSQVVDDLRRRLKPLRACMAEIPRTWAGNDNR